MRHPAIAVVRGAAAGRILSDNAPRTFGLRLLLKQSVARAGERATMKAIWLRLGVAGSVIAFSITAAASLSFSARINSERALHRAVAVPAGKSVEAEIETTSSTARLQCAIRSGDATRQFAIKQGNPCVVGVSNQGDSRVTVDLVVMTDSRAPIEITGTTSVQTLPSDDDN